MIITIAKYSADANSTTTTTTKKKKKNDNNSNNLIITIAKYSADARSNVKKKFHGNLVFLTPKVLHLNASVTKYLSKKFIMNSVINYCVFPVSFWVRLSSHFWRRIKVSKRLSGCFLQMINAYM